MISWEITGIIVAPMGLVLIMICWWLDAHRSLEIPTTLSEMNRLLNDSGEIQRWLKSGRFSEVVTAYGRLEDQVRDQQMRDSIKWG